MEKIDYNVGDVVVSKGFKIYDNCEPFLTVKSINHNNKSVLFKGMSGRRDMNSFRLATHHDYGLFEYIKGKIKYNPDLTDDEHQHISSVTGEPKFVYNNEIEAYKSAFHMCKKNDGEWVIYTCKDCSGIHIGKKNK